MKKLIATLPAHPARCATPSARRRDCARRRPLAGLLMLWLLASLACNLPLEKAPRPRATATPRLLPSATSSPSPTLANEVSIIFTPTATDSPTEAPSPTGVPAWTFPGLNILSAYPADSAAGALELIDPSAGPILYLTQPGDTLPALAKRFAVLPENIRAPAGMPQEGLLPPGTRLDIAAGPAWTLPSSALLPDSEIIYGPSALDFSVASYVHDAGAFLDSYSETVDGETLSGAEIVQRVANELSINPRVLLAFLEYRTGWVLRWPKAPVDTVYPIGFAANGYRGLYKELELSARQLSIGYYLWRTGSLGTLEFPKGDPLRISPKINAGTAALSLLFSKLYPRAEYGPALYGAHGFAAFYRYLFGDPFARASVFEPLYAPGSMDSLPPLELPFAAGEKWLFTGGPHAAWSTGSPAGALDFAPAGEGRGCYLSQRWATAMADGVVVRTGKGQVILSLDPGQNEQKGWALLYLHLAEQERVVAGTHVSQGDRLGHPSCEGGVSTGTHVHIARKYDGEWVGIGPDTPFVLSDWQVEPGSDPYLGRLVRADGQAVVAHGDGSGLGLIER